ncbi:hypothetical protein ES703_114874 [subsurface metagenome]
MLILVPSMLPDAIVYVASHVSKEFEATTAAPPPNAVKSTVTPDISLLLSPPTVLFQVAVTTSSTI